MKVRVCVIHEVDVEFSEEDVKYADDSWNAFNKVRDQSQNEFLASIPEDAPNWVVYSRVMGEAVRRYQVGALAPWLNGETRGPKMLGIQTTVLCPTPEGEAREGNSQMGELGLYEKVRSGRIQ